ncbi:MAG TPA: hypothetical protein VI306_22870 [Pyrinomonadaceae bacterium]
MSQTTRSPVEPSLEERTDEPVLPRPIEWLRENCLPIVGLLVVFFSVCLVTHYSSRQIDWTTTKDFIDALQNVVQISAFIVGGWWAYFKFVRGRAFQETLVSNIVGRFVDLDGILHLIATIQIENVGSSKIDFDHIGTALILFEYASTDSTEIKLVAYKRLTSFDLFNPGDEYIEPNETIELQKFVSIPGPPQLAYRLDVQICSKSGGIWNASVVVDNSALPHNARSLIVL